MIISFLLRKGVQEENCFWILCCLIENILPLNFFAINSGILTELLLLDKLLSKMLPKLKDFLNNIEMNCSILLFQWFACLFTNNFDENLTSYFLDKLFIDGIKALFQISIAILKAIESQMILLNDLTEIYQFLDTKAVFLASPQIVRNIVKSGQCKITNKKIFRLRMKILRSKFFQKGPIQYINHIEQKHSYISKLAMTVKVDEMYISTKEKHLQINFNQMQCSLNWPVCLFDHCFKYRSVEFFIFRIPSPPNIINNYFNFTPETSKIRKKYKFWVFEKQYSNLMKLDELVVERNEHYCTNPIYSKLLHASLESSNIEEIFNHYSVSNAVRGDIECRNGMKDFQAKLLNRINN